MSFFSSAGFGGIAAGAGGIVGSGISAAVSASEAKKARNFQRRVLNNRYQWMVNDLRKAGINPILAASLGAGGAPSAAAASVPDLGQSMARGIEAGVKGSKADAERRLIDQQHDTSAAQETQAQQMAAKAAADAQVAAANFRKIEQERRYMARQNPLMLPEGLDAKSWMGGNKRFLQEAGSEADALLKRFHREHNDPNSWIGEGTRGIENVGRSVWRYIQGNQNERRD